LWEPIVSGKTYLTELQESHQKRLWYLPAPPEAQSNSRSIEALGFELSATMVHEIEQVDLLALTQKPANTIFLTEKTAQPQVAQLKTKLEDLGSQVNYQKIDGPTIWNEDPDKGLVPFEVIKLVVQWMGDTLT